MKKIFWLAGEHSGDLHASFVMKQLNETEQLLEHYGVGGYRMAQQGLKQLFPFKQFNVMGFTEVIKHLSFFRDVEKKIAKWFDDNKPDLVVLVDYPGLNLRIAKIAHQKKIKVFYYISPQVWAWKKGRVKLLKKYCDKVACILPFEQEYLEKNGVDATYVGNPIIEEIHVEDSREEFAKKYDLDVDKIWICFFPGSRELEVERLLPEYLHAAKVFDDDDIQYLFSLAPSVSRKEYMKIVSASGLRNPFIIYDDNYNMMQHSYVSCVTSGTATLEAGFLGNPFIIVYKTSPTTFFLGKTVVKLDYIGLPNLIMGKGIVPEFIQGDATGFNIYRALQEYVNQKDYYAKMKTQLDTLHEEVGEKRASVETANLIKEYLVETSILS
ncbi:MAG: lipid-A-disaccharide synthase [Candidatus Zophobacter franzmannii]|nr:lipid-A-disaccharide synthase [Candidatus Zophobacter franzmannii]